MGRKRTIRAVLITLVLTLVIVGVAGYFLFNSIITQKDAKIKELNDQLSNDQIYVFTSDLKAGSVITPDDIELSRVLKTNVSTGMYMMSNDSGWEDEYGEYHEKADYYTLDEDGIASKVPVLIDEAIVGRQLKTNVSAQTPVMEAFMFVKNDVPTKDQRLEEFNYITIPSQLNKGDYVDVRIRFATGEDFVVLVGKKVEAIDGETTVYFKLNEEEIMLMASATIEAYINNGSMLYATKYSDPGTQLYKETIENYVEKYEEGIKLAIEAKDKEKILELANQSEDGEGEHFDSYEDIPEEYVAELKGRITPTKEADVLDDIALIAKSAGIAVEHAEAIKKAKAENNEDVLIYYKNKRVQNRTEISRTYAVKDEVLRVIRTTPNIVDTVKSWFNDRYNQNIADGIVVDQYKQLEAQIAAAPEVSYDPGVKTKAQLREEMNALATSRADAVQGKLESSANERKARRVAYLEELIGG